jgi:hypothetical protein
MNSNLKCFIYLTSFAGITSCKKAYNPPAIASSGSYLVVEGVINSGSDSTIIKLSNTVNLAIAGTQNPMLHASVAVESDQGTILPLTETTNGNYVSAGLNLNSSHTYRLSIKTLNNEQYYSDYVAVLNSPPIDSVYFRITNTGLNIYSATHDPINTIKYYRWDYGETWIIHPFYDSDYISNGDTVLERTLSQQIYTCWKTDTSSNIVLGSSAKLAKDIIVDNLITSLVSSSPKIANEYTIFLRQYALTADAYTFWTNLSKNTQQLGSIFDAQPSEINGNIHSATNPNETVIGYISVGSTSSIRIFISPRQLPAWPANQNYPDCSPPNFFKGYLYAYYPQNSNIPVNQVNEFINYNIGGDPNPWIPIVAIQQPGGPILGFTAAPPNCVDCTLQGTNKQPAYWRY